MNEEKSKIGRFQAMGLLQAARYYVLYGDLEKAKSFGINRAIFYAWAKHYGRSYVHNKSQYNQELSKQYRNMNEIAGEEIIVDEKTGYFSIGNKPNLPKDFDREIKEKIEKVVPYEKAWNAAIEYVSSFPKDILLDQRRFFKNVYLPIRDDFEKILNKDRKDSLVNFFKKDQE